LFLPELTATAPSQLTAFVGCCSPLSQTSLLSFNQIALKFDLLSGISLVKAQMRDARARL
jgi:hypothetical protein